MRYTIRQIAAALGAEASGAVDLCVTGAAEPADATADQLAVALKPAFAEGLARGDARAAILWQGADWRALGLEAAITAPRPRFAMAGLTALMDPGQGQPTGIHPTASVAEDAEIGDGVSLGAFCVVMQGARVGAGSVLGPHCIVGREAILGPETLLRERVTIGARVRIGTRFRAQPGVVIGGDGFSFVTPEESGVERVRGTLGDQGEIAPQHWARIHSLGAVSIGDDVEIGANSTIDSGTVRDTRVGSGTKIDNLVMLGHNVVVGRDCLLCAQSGVAGSTRIGDNVVLGGQTGVGDNLFVGDNVITGGGTIVLSNVPAGRVMLGYPANRMSAQMEIYKALRRLPRLFRDVDTLRKAVSKGGNNG